MSKKKKSATDDDAAKKPAEAEAELPQREPLTPDLVEDEAIRGDFMLRWALVLLSFLMACTLIAETRTLVHIKSGEYTLENFMPARTDVFSTSAEGSPWRNLSWLFDVVLAGTHLAAGAIGLTVLKAIIAAITFAVIAHTNRKDVSSWWGTVCAVLALLVCYPQMTAQPEIVTLLGLGLTLFFLNRWREDGERKHLTRLVILFAVWSNLDPRMFLGLAVIGLYAVGEWTGNWLGFSTGLPNSAQRKSLWIGFGLCVAAAMLNPFGWHSLLSPVALYGSEYPAFRELHPSINRLEVLQYYSMLHKEFWIMRNHNMIAGLVLLLAALVSFGLNGRRLDFGHLFVGIGFLAFAVLTTRDLAAAAIVCGVLATLNAQQWYEHTFRQDYSVQTSELVFSRGGRAVTVLSMFGLAYLAILGRQDLLGYQGRMARRVGFGFDYNLQASIDGLRDDMRNSLDDRPFNFSEAQGDVLVWIGKKPFIDSRLGVFAGAGDDLIKRFAQTRLHIRNGVKSDGEQGGWKATLDKYGITHVTPRLDTRLSSPLPDYGTHEALLRSDDWQMTRFGAASSVFYRTDIRKANPKLDTYLNGHQGRFTHSAFRSKQQTAVDRNEFARRPTFQEKYLSRPKAKLPNGVLLARHYNRLYVTVIRELQLAEREGRAHKLPLNMLQGSPPDQFLMSLLYLQIRSANAGLVNDPQNSEAYALLGIAYRRIRDFEEQLIRKSPGLPDLKLLEQEIRKDTTKTSRLSVGTLRFRQAVVAYRECLVIDPNNLVAARSLATMFDEQGWFESAREMFDRCVEIAKANPLPEGLDDSMKEAQQRLRAADIAKLAETTKLIEPVLSKIASAEPKMGKDREGRNLRHQAIEAAFRGGCLQRAVELLEGDTEALVTQPSYLILYVGTLLNLGRIEEAYNSFTDYNTKYEALLQFDGWQSVGAAIEVCQGKYARARSTYQRLAREQEDRGFAELAHTVPFTVGSMTRLSNVFARINDPAAAQTPADPWASHHGRVVYQAMHVFPDQLADNYLIAAVCDLELGNTKGAEISLNAAIEFAPDSAVRPLARIYWQLITGKAKPEIPPLVGESAKQKTAKSKSGSTVPVKAKGQKKP